MVYIIQFNYKKKRCHLSEFKYIKKLKQAIQKEKEKLDEHNQNKTIQSLDGGDGGAVVRHRRELTKYIYIIPFPPSIYI